MIPIFLFACSFACVIAGKVPDYINKCKYGDPSFDKCVIDNMPNVIPHLKDGIKSLHIPPLVPFRLEQITIEPSKGLLLKLKDLDIYGIDTAHITELKIQHSHMYITFHFDELTFDGVIDMNGKLMIMPVEGSCKCFITFKDFTVDYSFAFGDEERNGKKYFTTYNHTVNYSSVKMSSNLEKLFKDEMVGNQLKQLMDENWKEINDEFRPVITETIVKIAKNLIDGVTNSVPFDELFIV